MQQWFSKTDGDWKRFIDRRDKSGYTPLHYASRNSDAETCCFLLDHGADVNALTPGLLQSSLQRAAAMGKLDVVKLLVERGACIGHVDATGKRAVELAATNDHPSVIAFLQSVA